MKRCTKVVRALRLRVTEKCAQALSGMGCAVDLVRNDCSDPMQRWSLQKITGSAV